VGTGFHPELTGRENIYLNGAILGMKKAEIKKNFDEIVSFAEIDKFINTPVKRYSSGMYVRLAFAVAAHMEPEILLVDEVLAVGDIAFQKKCLAKMGDTAKLGRTILFVSHNMNAIRNLCERVNWIDNGQIKNIGPTYDVVRDYEEKQLKSFDIFSSIASRDPEEVRGLNFYISRVTITNSNGKNTNVFSYNQSMVLILDLYGEPEENKYGVEFKIFKDTGEFACTGTSGILHGVYFNRTVKKVQIDIGPLTLTNGKYNILLSIMFNKKRTDIWEDACCFHIVECHPFALPQEIKTPVCVIQHSFRAGD
jgi:lipopolysaccharide transport system ATP-binding protein